MKKHPVSRREFCANLLLAGALSRTIFAYAGKQEAMREQPDLNPSSGMEPAREIIYTGEGLEFVQLWDQLERIRQAKELALGNLVVLAATFHVGGEAERRHWKARYPELAEEIDKVPL